MVDVVMSNSIVARLYQCSICVSNLPLNDSALEKDDG